LCGLSETFVLGKGQDPFPLLLQYSLDASFDAGGDSDLRRGLPFGVSPTKAKYEAGSFLVSLYRTALDFYSCLTVLSEERAGWGRSRCS
jgi:hypothetical protein